MRRRGFLAAIATVGIGVVAGCSVLGGTSGPPPVAKQFVRATHDENDDRLRELAHPEGSAMNLLEADGWGGPQGSVSITSTSEESLSDNVAIEIIDYALSTGGETQQRTMNVELQQQDGDWRVRGAR